MILGIAFLLLVVGLSGARTGHDAIAGLAVGTVVGAVAGWLFLILRFTRHAREALGEQECCDCGRELGAVTVRVWLFPGEHDRNDYDAVWTCAACAEHYRSAGVEPPPWLEVNLEVNSPPELPPEVKRDPTAWG